MMTRLLLAFVLVAGLSATTLAANIQFDLGAAVTDDNTLPDVAVQVQVNLAAGEMMGGGGIDFTAGSAALTPLGAVVFQGAWAGFSAFDGNAYLSMFQMGTSNGPVVDPVANFTVPTFGLAPGVYTLDPMGPGTLLVDGVGAPLPMLTGTPLVITVTPEPATLGLLVLGGLAALRRRFA